MDSNSDTDFNDVFGGPPRRSSVQEIRYSFGDNMESGSRTSDETVVVVPRNPWSGLSEKPVFGEEGVIGRRRYSKNDFFDDVFKGNRSLTSSPRKYEMKDPSTASVSSPFRPLPPKAEPFASSFPSHFSLSAKLNKGKDLSMSKSKVRSSNDSSYNAYSPMSRLSGQANQDKDQEMRSGFQGNLREDSNSSDIRGNENRFHFSIHKWANKGGVPISIPTRGSQRFKEKDKLQRSASAQVLLMEQNENLHDNFSSNDRMSSNDNNENGSPIDSRKEVDELVRKIEEGNILKSESESWPKSRKKNVSGDNILPSSEAEKKSHYSLSTHGKGTYKPRPKPMNSVFDYGNNDGGNDEKTKNSDISEKKARELSEILDGKNIKEQDMNKRATSDNVEAGSTSVRRSPRKSWDNGKGRVGGNVKDFTKIFNQEASPKPRADIDSENHSSRSKQRHAVKPEIEPSTSMSESDEKIHRPNLQKKKKSSDVHAANCMFNGASEKDTASDIHKTTEDPLESSEINFSVEDVTPVPEEKSLPQYGIDPEEIKAIDAKIRQWSNGKQGNIRSLLSTLQFVLWPDSGWKPVPLADIIEGRTVKRSYQKALLCLHPDKLQQKGAASNKKYIAEKVFDILQDAWTQFNLLDPI